MIGDLPIYNKETEDLYYYDMGILWIDLCQDHRVGMAYVTGLDELHLSIEGANLETHLEEKPIKGGRVIINQHDQVLSIVVENFTEKLTQRCMYE
jgi:hypothetical protein